jgi:hypothetical protein
MKSQVFIVFYLEYLVSLNYKTCNCVDFKKKEICKHLLAAFCYVRRHGELLISNLNPLVTNRRGGTQIPSRRTTGRALNQRIGALNR